MSVDPGWATHQLAAFLEAITAADDAASVSAAAVERVAEMLDAEFGALVTAGVVVAAVGFPPCERPDVDLVDLASVAGPRSVDTTWVREAHAVVTNVDSDSRVIVVRVGEPFSSAEVGLQRALGHAFGQTLRTLSMVARERAMREASESIAAERARLVADLTEREALLRRLSRIQRAISERLPLAETLNTIATGVAELIGDDVVGLRLIDQDEPSHYYLAAYCGIPDALIEQVRRGPIGEGAGGLAIAEARVVTINDYQSATNVVTVLRDDHLTAAMAAPVHENGKVAGSLVVASRKPGRRYTETEREALVALADHASLAISDAQNREALDEAQRAKQMFLAMVSHELKTPLTVIMGSIHTLRRHGLTLPDEMRQELIETARQRGVQLEGLIDSLLRGARAELAGETTCGDLAELVRHAVAGFGQLGRVVVAAVPAVDVVLDAAAFRDVLGILLENAIAHSASSSAINVAVTLENDEVVAQVTNDADQPLDLDKDALFAAFHRGAEARSSGVGLGLHIAGRLADSLGGRITVTSDSGRVTFTLRCPAHTSVATERIGV